MSSASWALQQGVFSALTDDATLAGLLGGSGRLYDHVPQGAACPYVVLGPVTARDWSTAGEEGCEHILALHVWSQASGKHEAQEIAERLRSRLHEASLSLSGHRLVNLRHEFTEVRRESDGRHVRAHLRFRAVTEPV